MTENPDDCNLDGRRIEVAHNTVYQYRVSTVLYRSKIRGGGQEEDALTYCGIVRCQKRGNRAEGRTGFTVIF